MFREYRSLRKEPGLGRRRWFESEELDLAVWLGPDAAIVGLQFTYDRGEGPRALTWRPVGGWTPAVIDSGDASLLRNESPVLQPGGEVPWDWLAARWKKAAPGLEPGLREAIGVALADRRPVSV